MLPLASQQFHSESLRSSGDIDQGLLATTNERELFELDAGSLKPQSHHIIQSATVEVASALKCNGPA